MSFFASVGPITWIASGETQYWEYGWGDEPDHGLNVAGPNLDRNGSFGSEVIAFDQGKQRQLGPTVTSIYYVTVKNVGPYPVLYNLQVGGFA
jgi:hypothetical protein